MGELVIVGTGIQSGRDFTATAQHHLKTADRVFYLVADLLAERMILDLNAKAESMRSLYEPGKRRRDTYHEMVERILEALRAGNDVCVACYGHPGVFAYPMHLAIKKARAEGYTAEMLPAVSSIDCLIADMGIDPAVDGLQVYDATDFVVRPRTFDPATALVLLQIDVVGDPGYTGRNGCEGLPLLRERLIERYGPEHSAVVYSSSEFVWCMPSVRTIALSELSEKGITAGSLLYVPAKMQAALDEGMARRLDAMVGAARKT